MSTNSKDFLLFRRLLKETRPYWGHILLIFVISVLATPLALLIPLPLKVIVDSVLGDNPLPGFLAAATPQFLHGSHGRILLLAALLEIFVSLMRQLQGLANSYLHCDWRLHFDEGRVEVRKVNHQQEEVLSNEVLA